MGAGFMKLVTNDSWEREVFIRLDHIESYEAGKGYLYDDDKEYIEVLHMVSGRKYQPMGLKVDKLEDLLLWGAE